MNEQLDTEDTQELATETDSAPKHDESPTANSKAGAKKSSAVGWFALLVALLAAAGAGYLWQEQRKQAATNAEVARLTENLRARDQELAQLQDQFAELLSTEASQAEDLSGLLGQVDSQGRRLDEIPLRVGRLERALENVPGVADQARSAWLLAEAEYYLRIANAQLGLARNVDIALRALELADEKLRDVGDPGLTRVRSVLADEVTALRAVPRPDSEGIALRLGSLARSLESLPLSQQTPERYAQDYREEEGNSGWQRALQSTKTALLSVIRVKRTDESVIPMRTEAEESLLRRGMETELDIARLALIRGDRAVYQDALAGVTERLERHFDTDAQAVKAAREQLLQLAEAKLPESLPDISASLNLLLKLGSGSANP